MPLAARPRVGVLAGGDREGSTTMRIGGQDILRLPPGDE
jgi:hypothetical protein